MTDGPKLPQIGDFAPPRTDPNAHLAEMVGALKEHIDHRFDRLAERLETFIRDELAKRG